MPTTISIEEASSKLTDMVSFVQSEANPITILQAGVPVAQIVPFKAHRVIKANPRYAFSISDQDLFSDDGDMCEEFKS